MGVSGNDNDNQSGAGKRDRTWLLTTAAGVVMLGLVGVRAFTSTYLERAERVGWGWLFEGVDREGEKNNEGEGVGKEEVVVIVTIWDERVIATVVMNVDGSSRLEHRRKAVVRAWTTLLKYRGVGIGKGVLEEAVKIAVRRYGCREVVFGEEHASEFFSVFFSFLDFLSRLCCSLSHALVPFEQKREEEEGEGEGGRGKKSSFHYFEFWTIGNEESA